MKGTEVFSLLKMFSTQLNGLFKRLYEKEEEAIEDSARLLAQAIIGEGKVYIYATNEMQGIVSEAIESAEPLQRVEKWNDSSLDNLTQSDRFLLFTRYSNDEVIFPFAKQLHENNIPFISISTISSTEEEGIQEIADVYIDLKLTKGLLPDEEGIRFGYPALMAALFVYYGIKFTLDEILKEYDL